MGRPTTNNQPSSAEAPSSTQANPTEQAIPTNFDGLTIDLRSEVAEVYPSGVAEDQADSSEKTREALRQLMLLQPPPKPPSAIHRAFGDWRWVVVLTMLATTLLFAFITAQAILAGETALALIRFLAALGLGTFCLMVHRSLQPDV